MHTWLHYFVFIAFLSWREVFSWFYRWRNWGLQIWLVQGCTACLWWCWDLESCGKVASVTLLCALTPSSGDLFSSRGNWIGEAPYKIGRPCSACPPSYQGSCNNNMCFSGPKSNRLLWFWICPGLWWASSWAPPSKSPSPKTRSRIFLFLRHELDSLHSSDFSLLIPFSKCLACAGRKQPPCLPLSSVASFFLWPLGKWPVSLMDSALSSQGRSNGSSFWTLKAQTH